MEFNIKPNTGFIFKNKFKKDEIHPDLKGDVYLDKTLIQELLNESKESVIKITLGCYKKQAKDGNTFLTVYVSKPYQKPDNPQAEPSPDDDLPF